MWPSGCAAAMWEVQAGDVGVCGLVWGCCKWIGLGSWFGFVDWLGVVLPPKSNPVYHQELWQINTQLFGLARWPTAISAVRGLAGRRSVEPPVKHGKAPSL